MPRINLLDKNTINQIAAGEVIERPASIVKELLENSIDAGATSITCEISGGGIELIRITDNGSGIEKDDVKIAFLRHSTSKIKDAEDLVTITSLGFRGEALASIAAVSETEVITKTRNSFVGTRYIIDGGEEKSFEEVGCPDGTTFIVRDLFKNVPARKKFLKSPPTEASYIIEIVERIAISHPDISIKLINNKKTVMFTNGNRNLRDIIFSVYGKEITANLIHVNYVGADISVEGYIAKPVVARGNRNLENYFVNGRYIKSPIVYKAIEEAYRPYMMQHKYPFTALNIDINPGVMDVNVHPTKQEVRFADGEAIYKAVYVAVSEVLSAKNMIPDFEPESDKREKKKENIQEKIPEPYELNRKSELNEVKEEKAAYYVQKPKSPVINNVENKSRPDTKVKNSTTIHESKVEELFTAVNEGLASAAEKKAEPVQLVFASVDKNEREITPKLRAETKEELKHGLSEGYKIIGQFFSTYWLIEKGNEIFFIDQHAAHEKIIFEKLVNQNKDFLIDKQMISPPLIISLSANEAAAVEQNRDLFDKCGFTVDAFGGREFAVSEVPVNLYGLDPEKLLLELVNSLLEPGNKSISQSIHDRLATAACKAAVKGNMRMSENEAKSLIEQLLQLDNPFNCPHGRPVITSMTKDEVERKFKRIVN